MQDSIWCYLKLIYLQTEWIVEFSKDMKVSAMVELLNEHFSSDLKGKYFYEASSKRLIDECLTFQENQVESGNYLYFI